MACEMAVIELFVTECIKSVLKIVEGIVEGFAKRPTGSENTRIASLRG